MDTPEVQILLIDDDEEQSIIVSKYLKRTQGGPYAIRWAADSAQAMDALRQCTFDLCLLDYYLGDRNGIELLDEIRAAGFALPVILLTGQSSFELDMNAMAKGVSDFIDKNDLNPVLLERSMRYTLENHRARVALQRMNEELEERVRERTAELNRSNQELEAFAHMVASDLQAPLRALNEQIQRMRQKEAAGGDDTNAAHRLLDPVLHATGNLELLVQSVLDYSRAGREPERFDIVDMNAVLREAWAKHAGAAAALGAELDAADLPPVRGDRWQLAGLFENLFDNALKYRGANPPRITVRAEHKDADCLFTVSDNGIGIDEENEEEIFIMFSRVAPENAPDGAGIGLTICRKIVGIHGGRIWVDSEPGKGTTFCFLLPA